MKRKSQTLKTREYEEYKEITKVIKQAYKDAREYIKQSEKKPSQIDFRYYQHY